MARVAQSVRRLAVCLAAGLLSLQAVAAGPVARVAVLATGDLLLDGRPVTLEALDTALAGFRARQGVVWYYRENAAGEPPPQAMEVISLIIRHQLPISMSQKADFSDINVATP
jgi:hypothetical protein